MFSVRLQRSGGNTFDQRLSTEIIGAAKKIHTVLQLRHIVPPLEI
jgi:hypothetical protein